VLPHQALSSSPQNEPAGGDEGIPAAREEATEPVNDGSDVRSLLQRMRDGDRGAAATFVTRYDARIRRRIRGKLSPAMRRIFDSQEILSTVGRRLDSYVRSGQLEATNEGELWALVFRMANNAVIDKVRVFHRLQAVEGEDGQFAQELYRRLRQAERKRREGAEVEIDRALRLLDDHVDRAILSLWLAGVSHTVIAEHVELAPTAVRKRWQKIRTRLYECFSRGSRG
jgi:DNA-directed RNA polymerase specialized sigma24 family protein